LNIALFGGTFDPIHTGHLQAAKVAARRFNLDKVLFIPTGTPPHKYRDQLTPFPDRFAMVALACASEPRFVPSLLEAPKANGRPRYSIATVRAIRRTLEPKDRLYFLVGVDAFLDLPQWKDYRRLLELVNFVIVSRPGFDPTKTTKVLSREMLREPQRDGQPEEIPLRSSTLYIVRGVNETVASRDIRQAIRAGRPVTGLVPPLVEEYIVKEGLYRRHQQRQKA
jgi:nicotinate-nucleotide adenylyltransferase